MKVAALYDVHGMPWALEAVLAEVDADAIVFGGDWFGGPYNDETYERILRVENATLIRGNAENDDPRGMCGLGAQVVEHQARIPARSTGAPSVQ